jgi:hypothetical protein
MPENVKWDLNRLKVNKAKKKKKKRSCLQFPPKVYNNPRLYAGNKINMKSTINSVCDFVAQALFVGAALRYFTCSCDHPSVLPQVCAHTVFTGRGSCHAVCEFLH